MGIFFSIEKIDCNCDQVELTHLIVLLRDYIPYAT